MLSIKMLSRSSAAADYYKAGDYYVNGIDANNLSYWQGKGAAELGLTGAVAIDKFAQLLEGRVGEQQLGRKTKDGIEHKCGWDLTFSAPKSVSIMALVGGDKRLITAVKEAAIATMKYIEQHYAQTRQLKQGNLITTNAQNIVSAAFVHTTSREADPQLHVHNVLLNMTKREDEAWRSIESKYFYDDSMLLGQMFRSNLAQKVIDLGYEIEVEHKKGFFEIKEVPQEVNQWFSKRREQIETLAKEFGVIDAKAMDRVNLMTRKNKSIINSNELYQTWHNETKALNFDSDRLVKQAQINCTKDNSNNTKDNSNKTPSTYLGADYTVDIAAKTLFEMEAVCTRQALTAKALALSLGNSSSNDIDKAISKAIADKKIFKSHVPGEALGTLFTTKAAYRKENYILKLMRDGKNTKASCASSIEIDNATRDSGYTNDQLNTIKHIITSADQIIGVQGYAGTGKTHMLKTVVNILQAKDYNIKALGSYNSTVKILENELKVKAQTTASFISTMNKNLKFHHYQGGKEVWLLDEASQVNANDMADLLTLLRKTKARLVLTGDKAQLGAVEWGMPFNLMIKNGLSQSTMAQIVRQEDRDLKAAVEATIQKDYQVAINKLKDDTYVSPLRDNLINQLVADYFAQNESLRQNSLIVIPDNATRNQVMAIIRNNLIIEGKVQDVNFKTALLIKTGLNHSEKTDARFYQKNQIVEFNRAYHRLNINKTERLIVCDIKPQDNLVVLGRLKQDELSQDKTQAPIIWNPAKIAKTRGAIEVYDVESKNIGLFDQIIWTKSDKTLNLKNRDRGEVKEIKDGKILIAFGATEKWVDPKKDKNFDYSYVQTAHVAQGMTYNRAFVLFESYRKNLVNQKSFYVAISRARQKTKLYTDNLDKLIKALEHRVGDKTSSIENFSSKTFKVESKLATLTKDFFSYSKDKLTAKIRSIFGKDIAEHQAQEDVIEETKAEKTKKAIIDAKEVTHLLNSNVAQIAQQILGQYNKKVGRNMYFGRNKGSLAVTISGQHQGTWTDFATSESGNLITLIQKHYGLNFKQALEEAAKLVNYTSGDYTKRLDEAVKNKANQDELSDKQKLKIKTAQKLAQEAKNIEGTIAEKYLKEIRGIDLKYWPKNLKYHDGVYSKINKAKHPALLVIARDKDNRVQAVQAIYLNKETARKADVAVHKQTFGPIKGALFAAKSGELNNKTAIICEGPEDALSIFKSTSGKDVYACLGKSNFNNLNQEKLIKYDTIILALDNDGQKPSQMPTLLNTASRLADSGKHVILAQPNNVKQDYNDLLKSQGAKSVDAVISNGKSFDSRETDCKIEASKQKLMEKEI